MLYPPKVLERAADITQWLGWIGKDQKLIERW